MNVWFYPSLFPFEVYFLGGDNSKVMRPPCHLHVIPVLCFEPEDHFCKTLYEHCAVGGDPGNTWVITDTQKCYVGAVLAPHTFGF